MYVSNNFVCLFASTWLHTHLAFSYLSIQLYSCIVKQNIIEKIECKPLLGIFDIDLCLNSEANFLMTSVVVIE